MEAIRSVSSAFQDTLHVPATRTHSFKSICSWKCDQMLFGMSASPGGHVLFLDVVTIPMMLVAVQETWPSAAAALSNLYSSRMNKDAESCLGPVPMFCPKHADHEPET